VSNSFFIYRTAESFTIHLLAEVEIYFHGLLEIDKHGNRIQVEEDKPAKEQGY
jgi:hypothetical protein